MAAAARLFSRLAVLGLTLLVTAGSALAEQSPAARRSRPGPKPPSGHQTSRDKERPNLYEQQLRQLGLAADEFAPIRRRVMERLALDASTASRSLAEQYAAKYPGAAVAVVRMDEKAKSFQLPKQPPESIAFDGVDRSNAVYIAWVQDALNRAMNLQLVPDGIKGPHTTRAIRAFQKAHGLEVTGVVGPATERALSRLADAPPPSPRFFAPARLRGDAPLDIGALVDGPTRPPGPDPHRDPMLNDAAFIDVRTEGGKTSVLVWLAALRGVPPPRLGLNWGDVVRFETPDALEAFAATRGAVLSVGEPLPAAWEVQLERAGIRHVHVSERSPKRTLDEHVDAAAALTARYDPAKTQIFDALPRAAGKGRDKLIEELELLGLPREHVDGWGRLDGEMRDVEAETNRRLEVAAKPAILEALRSGDRDTVVLFAHSLYGSIRLPSGDNITREELQAIRRADAPRRTIVLISCGAGGVDTQTTAGTGTTGIRPASTAEILLENRLATTVIAPPGPISATEIPRMLRLFLGMGATLNDAFHLPMLMRIFGWRFDGRPEPGDAGE